MSTATSSSAGHPADAPPPRKGKRARLLKLLVVCLAVTGIAVELYYMVPEVRLWVLVRATRLGLPTLPLMLRSLDDEDSGVRYQARTELQAMGPDVVPRLTQALQDRDPDNRVRALKGLEVLALASGDGQQAIAESLRRDAVPAVSEALKDEVPHVRIAAIRALSTMTRGTVAAVPTLVAVVASSQDDEEERAEAAGALGRIGPAAGSASPVLVRALKDPSGKVRESAAEALSGVGTGTRDELLGLTDVLDDPEAFDEAAEALGRIRATDITPLIEQASSKDARTRWLTVRALGLVRPQGREPREAIPALTAALKDPDERVRKEASAALGKIRESTPTPEGTGP